MIKGAIFGAGFIGLNFIRYGLDHNYQFSVLDIKDKPKNLSDKVIWIKGDIINREYTKAVLKNADIAYYFISQTVPGDILDDFYELNLNLSSTIHFLNACHEMKVKRVVFISSASVYGNQKEFPIHEGFSTDPISTHGIYKLMSEKFFYFYKVAHGLDCKIMRLSNPYGPGQDIYGKQGIVAITIGKCMMNKPLEVRGDGSSLRDFIYIEDVMEALNLLSTKQSNEIIFNIGSGIASSINDLIDLIEKKTGKTLKINHTIPRVLDITSSHLDISKAEKELNFKPRTSLEGGVSKTVEYYLK